MKILTLTTLFPNQQQPIHAVFVKNRISALAEICEVKVVAPVPMAFPLRFFSEKYRIFSRIPASEFQNGIQVFHPRYLVTPKFGRSLYGFMYFFSILIFMIKLRRKYDFDLLDIHWAYPDGFAGILFAMLFNKPATVTVRGSDINEFTRFFLRRKMIAYALKRAKRVIAVCEDMARKVQNLGVNRSRIAVIPNGVDTDRFYPMKKEDMRRKLNLAQDSSIILSVGRLANPKRFDHLIDASGIIIDDRNNNKISLIILGSGEHEENLKGQVKALGLEEYVELAGAKPNEDLVYWYNAADVFCLASSSEGWPNVIFESLACGTPVVAYSAGGVPEVLNSEEYGILVEKQEPEALAESLHEALSRKWNTDKILKYAHSNTWDKVAEKVYSTFKVVIEENR